MTTPASPAAASADGRPPRRRKPPRPVEVVEVSRLAPRLVSVWVTGDALESFQIDAPTGHVKVFLPLPGQDAPLLPEFLPEGQTVADDERPVVRTYTPRRFDPRTRMLELQFVLHGVGPASEWAERVRVGDQLAVAGPGGRFSLDPTVQHWWIAGDESAIPAVGTLLEALPESASAEVHLEVAGADDEIELASPAKTSITWHHRRAAALQDGAVAWGAELHEAARAAALPDGAVAWVACEAAAMRGIRKHFLADRGLSAGSLVTRGYWRLGEANHPDHDYGDD